MKKSYFTLEVVCHRDGKKDEKLVFMNNKYTTAPIINRPFMSNEGMCARIENQKVDLLRDRNISNISLPEDIDSFSIILFKKTIYKSNECSITITDSQSQIAKVGTNLFAYESTCNSVLLVEKRELNKALQSFAVSTQKYLRNKELNRIKESAIIKNKQLEELDEFYADSFRQLLVDEENVFLI